MIQCTQQWTWGYPTDFPVSLIIIFPPASKLKEGFTGFTPVRLSVCGQNRVRSVSSTILIGSISYLHIISSNFRRCVACKVCFKTQKGKILQILFDNFDFVFFWLGIQYDSIVWVIMRWWGVSSESRHSSCSSSEKTCPFGLYRHNP